MLTVQNVLSYPNTSYRINYTAHRPAPPPKIGQRFFSLRPVPQAVNTSIVGGYVLLYDIMVNQEFMI